MLVSCYKKILHSFIHSFIHCCLYTYQMVKNISSLYTSIVEIRLCDLSLPFLSEIDWTNEIRLILTALLLGGIM